MANSPHDALFRYTFTQPEHAAALLAVLLPAHVAAGLEWHTLTVLPGTRLDRDLRRHQTDILLAVRGDNPCLVQVIVEHSSRVDAWTALRILEYCVGVLRQLVPRTGSGLVVPRAMLVSGKARPRRHIQEIWRGGATPPGASRAAATQGDFRYAALAREGAAPGTLPPVFAVVVHHGREPWTAATQVANLVEPGGREGAGAPQYSYTVKSLADMDADAIDGLALTVLGKLTLAFLQLIPGAGAHQLAVTFRRLGGLVRRLLSTPSGIEAMQALSEYVLLTTSVSQRTLIEVVKDEMNPEAGDIMESTGMRLIRQGRLRGLREGRVEGREEGRRELLIGLVQRRFGPLSPQWSDRLAHADTGQLDRFAARLLDAATIEELLDRAPE